MANTTSVININIDTKIKDEATIILKSLGLNISTFINMALTQVVKRNGIPFKVEKPTSSKEINEMINNPQKYPRYNNREDLKKALLKDD